ncbi:MAG: hypothetical protein ACLGHL_00405 [Actinomycetota bacterium]
MRGAGSVLALFLIEWTVGWVGAAAWTQRWNVIKRGHFRITAWIVAAIAILGVLANNAAAPETASTQRAFVLAMGAGAIVYLIAQYLQSDLAGVVTGYATAALGAVALALSADLLGGWGVALAAGGLLAGAVFFGAVTNGMMLGHWYLNQPGLQPWALARLTQLAMAGVVLSGLLGLVSAGRLMDASTEGAVLGLPGFGQDFGLYFFFIWLVLLIFSGVVVWMARRCVNIKSIQSATGLYYVAILTAGVAEFLVRYLMVNAA